MTWHLSKRHSQVMNDRTDDRLNDDRQQQPHPQNVMQAHQSGGCNHALEFVAHHVPARDHHFFPGFHRPLRVVPPSATPSQQHTPSPLHSRFHPVPSHAQPAPPPPPYTSRYFPSHFFPEKMYHYWFVPQHFAFFRPEIAILFC